MRGADCTRRLYAGCDIGKMPACRSSRSIRRPSGCRWPFTTAARRVVVRERAGNAASERILPLTARVLAEAGVSLRALGGIAYGAGPGSFTGVRIACGVVQGLAFGADLPVFGVPTLGAIAQPRGARTAGRACSPASTHGCAKSTSPRTLGTAKRWTRVGDAAVRKPRRRRSRPTRRLAWRRRRLRRVSGARAAAASAPTSTRRSFPTRNRSPNGRGRISSPGEGADAAGAQPLYVRHRVALTTAERVAGLRL